MKILIALCILSIIATAKATDGPWKGGFRVRFGVELLYGTNYFIKMPTTTTDAIAQNLIETTPPTRSDGPLSYTTMYCFSYKHLCLLYDSCGYIAGMQIAFPEEDFSNGAFDLSTMGYVSWTTELDGEDVTYKALQMYFAASETLKDGGCITIENSSKLLQEEGVWVTVTNGDLLLIPKNETELLAEGVFKRQACIPAMGRHYYYEMTEETECTAESMLSWFPLFDSEELIGIGFNVIGNLTIREGARNYYESPTTTAVSTIVPDSPSCYKNYPDTHGISTMHIYFVDEPWYATCIGEWISG